MEEWMKGIRMDDLSILIGSLFLEKGVRTGLARAS
jgi:hypothetical protein